jgi:hypothetical protein
MEESPTTHRDFGDLEAYRRGEADEATVEHVAGCAECQLNLEEIDAVAALVRDGAAALPSVPEAIEERLLWNARQNAARVRRQNARPTALRWAIAASLLLSLGALVVWRTSKQDSAPSPALPRERAGVRVSTLDIVDALALARQLGAAQPALRQAQGERPGNQRYDVNHDGRVDDADVERIVRQTVALGDA